MKMRTLLASVVAVVVTAGLVFAAEKEFKASCPVSGGPAKESSFVEFEGAKVYFCCQGCPKKFEADSEKYASKAHYQMLQTGEAIQVACPLSGKPVNAETATELVEQKVAFCCGGCQKKFKEADDQLALALSPAAFVKAFTTQTECPVSGKKISAAVSTKHDGKNVYFCCEGCVPAFEADPEKYTKK